MFTDDIKKLNDIFDETSPYPALEKIEQDSIGKKVPSYLLR